MEIVIYITISILILDIALIKQRMLANIETSNPYHAQYILRRRDDYLVLFDRDALSCRFFYDAFPGMRLRHQVTDDDRLAHSPADRMYTGKDHQKYTFCTK
ncbi:type IV secretion protein Rhs [Escherichia coli]|nr:type IV secretion protein Rhs [Escherichia coli]EFN8262254.1 type IV secretion protein Rhs [Escherichia coli]